MILRQDIVDIQGLHETFGTIIYIFFTWIHKETADKKALMHTHLPIKTS